jgi:hypothetical protein
VEPLLPRVLTATGAGRLGLTEAQIRTELRRGRWRRLGAGVLLTRPDEPTRNDWINAGLHIGGRQSVVSGWDAVHLRGLGATRPPGPRVFVLVPRGRSRVVGGLHLRASTRPVTFSRLSALDELLPDARIAGVARAVADTALMYPSLAPVRALVTEAVQQQCCSVDELWTELESGPRNGSRWLRQALEDVSAGAASISEAELAELMRAANLPPFELNVPILDAAGRHIATADVLWRTLRAVLEVDSRAYHFLEPDWRATMRRHNELTRYGLAVTHYPPRELRRHSARVLADVENWLRARANELGVPYPPTLDDAGSPFRVW